MTIDPLILDYFYYSFRRTHKVCYWIMGVVQLSHIYCHHNIHILFQMQMVMSRNFAINTSTS